MRFRNELALVKSRLKYGPKNLTNCRQPVDAGYQKLLKTLSLLEQQLWLEQEENIEKWLGNAEREDLTAKERRILITIYPLGGGGLQIRPISPSLFSKDRMPYHHRWLEGRII